VYNKRVALLQHYYPTGFYTYSSAYAVSPYAQSPYNAAAAPSTLPPSPTPPERTFTAPFTRQGASVSPREKIDFAIDWAKEIGADIIISSHWALLPSNGMKVIASYTDPVASVAQAWLCVYGAPGSVLYLRNHIRLQSGKKLEAATSGCSSPGISSSTEAPTRSNW
jgi:hypothetical protein